jgi:hypothetical protein
MQSARPRRVAITIQIGGSRFFVEVTMNRLRSKSDKSRYRRREDCLVLAESGKDYSTRDSELMHKLS